MPTIIDEYGEREVSDAELAKMDAEAEERWQAFWASLKWQPIAEYDREAGRPELLRAGERSAFGFWGPATMIAYEDEAEPDPSPDWRSAEDSLEEVRLDFEPTEFAVVEDDEWRLALIVD